MPYIKKIDRQIFKQPILDVLENIQQKSDSIEKCEAFQEFANELIRSLIANHHKFDYPDFSPINQKSQAIKLIVQNLYDVDLLQMAGKLNYVISTILWGFLGQAPGFDNAGYGQRTYSKGILENILNSVGNSSTHIEQRLQITICGVLSDIIDEVYRRPTAEYENAKILENGDLWDDAGLIL